MFSMLFGPSIEVDDQRAIISGLSWRPFEQDVNRLYGTTTITKYMLSRVNSRKFEVKSFFLLELNHLITKLLQLKSTRVNRRDLVKVQELIQTETWVQSTLVPQPSLFDMNKLKRTVKLKPLDPQLRFLETYTSRKASYHLKGLLLDGKAGSGKAQSLMSRIKVPGGWKFMYEMKVGDEVVAADGTTSIVTGVYPQGVTELYRVHFADGRHTDVNPEHLWKVHSRKLDIKKDVPHDQRWRIQDTNWMIERLNTVKGERLYIPLAKSEQSADIKLPVDPYILGVLLGDGCLTGSSVKVAKPSQHVLDRVNERLPEHLSADWIYGDTNEFSIKVKPGYNSKEWCMQRDLRRMQIMGKHSYDKFVPQEYFNASHNQRLELLRGLLDTDGTVDGQKTISFSSTSKLLSESVQYLVRSLGGIAKISVRTPHYTYKGERKEGRTDYRLHIRFPDPDTLFTIPNKKERAQPSQYSKSLKLEIVKIEKLKDESTQCISIDHPDHLYITDDFIVTHNTALSLMWSESLPKGKTVGFVPLNVIEEVWANHMTNNIKHEVWVKPPKFWHSKMDRPPQKDDEYYFVHYEFMLDPLCEKYMRMIHSFNTGNPAFKMIVDECHNFNDPNSKRTKKLIEYNEVYGFTDALPMSGTPIKGVGKESYTIFCLIDSFFKGNVRKAFLDGYGRSRDKLNELLAHRIGAEKYTIAVLDGMGDAPAPERVKVKVPNAEHFTLDSIRNQMQVYIQDRYKYYSNNMEQHVSYFNDIISGYRAHCVKRNDQKALSELDEYLRIVNKFRKDGYNNFTDSDLSKRAKEIELDIEEWMRPTERKHFRNAKSIVKYVGLKIQGEALGNVLGKARIEAVKALVEHADLPSYIDHVEKKTLIFTDHVDVVYECDDHLTKQGYDTIFVYGNNASERDKLVAQFGESETKNPLITTFKSLSTGYPLLMANQVLCMNAPWRDYTLTQTIARVHRQGQTAPTFAYMFELDTNGRENVTGRNLDIMQWSREQVAQIMSVQHGEDVTLVGVAGTEDLFDADHTLWDESVTPPKVVTHVSPMGLF